MAATPLGLGLYGAEFEKNPKKIKAKETRQQSEAMSRTIELCGKDKLDEATKELSGLIKQLPHVKHVILGRTELPLIKNRLM